MNCNKGKGWKSRLMMFGCILPVIAIFALPLFGVDNDYLVWLAFLACPLAMIVMMRMNNDEKCH
ncbi:hypothetical protein COV11_00855 [Candidatus Woesearchaeota archaeon CG10_big_fil_rev_8_21_14_0_10_30_7]|nr:MAG: hypothetical protein COV11_00855 [Candidatus Woesearchaeota archaeon CG10_big_fil_rev_8_21_14_0_10_30_7]